MGKGTDKLYITHSEWSSGDQFSASAGSNVNTSSSTSGTFKRLPYNFCALSLQPFEHPVCTADGTIFDLTNILPWLKKHGTNPVDGSPLSSKELIKLHYAKNEEGEYVDPVTYKVFTDNTHIVALRNTGNVFAYDTVERLNIKAKNWRDLVSDEEFSRRDIITLQDPHNLSHRDLSSFKYIKEGAKTLTEEQEAQRAAGVNTENLGSAAKILKAKEAVAKARAEREAQASAKSSSKALAKSSNGTTATSQPIKRASQSDKAAIYTTGRAAASLTSTGLTPETSGALAQLTDEEYLLTPKRVKTYGYARLSTTKGDLNIELLPEHAPKAVWNFIKLSKSKYYSDIPFHRNIKNFMIQGGDPTGTGRGGQSCWGKNFEDEIQGPEKFDARGMLAMANKGKNTNGSQFFITYRSTPHLDKKHSIFGRVVGGMDVLSKLEGIPTDEKDRPTETCRLTEVIVYVDPFEEFQKERKKSEVDAEAKEDIKRQGGTEDDRTTWTGKRLRVDRKAVVDDGGGGVGKYLKAAKQDETEEDEIVGEWDEEMPEEPVKKKVKSGGFGNFDGW